MYWPVARSSKAVVAHQTEELPLVIRRAQPPAAPVAQDGVENHHPLDHPADDTQPPVSVVRLADRFVQRLVVNVVEAPLPHRPGLDDTDESAGRETRHELAAVLAARRSGEGAVLPLKEAARMHHHRHEELTLAQGESETGQGVHAAFGDAVVAIVPRVFVRQRNSSIPRG